MSFLQALGIVSWTALGLVFCSAANSCAEDKQIRPTLFFFTLAIVSFAGVVWLVAQ